MNEREQAPGRPGIEPRWTSVAKSGAGTALNPASRVWFTLSHGILNEIHDPRVDQACVRDLVEVAGGLLAAGAHEDTRRAPGYLQATQNAPRIPRFLRKFNLTKDGQ